MPPARSLPRTALHLMGWRVEGHADDRPAVVIGAPHTTNTDFFLFLLVAGAAGLRLRFLAKRSLFRFPLGLLIRALGGIPVDRGRSTDLVSATASLIREHRAQVGLLPKGSRGARRGWKSGFYHMARTADVPVVMVSLNYAQRVAHVSPPLTLTGDVRQDMDRVRAFFAGARGRRPELDDVIRLDMEE